LDLAEAIRRAQPGDTIQLPAGDWLLEACLIVDKPLIIRGVGRDQTRLLSSAELFAVQFTGSGPWLMEKLTIEHVGKARADVVDVKGGEITVRQCRFTGAVFDGEGGWPLPGCGIRIRGNARGLISECVCDCNGKHGIEMSEQAQPVLEGNTCENNEQSGIAYFEKAGGTARNNTCRRNGHHGTQVAGLAQPILESNTCEYNNYSGIAYFDGGGTARNNTCRGNGLHGIEVGDLAQPVLEGNACQNNGGSGIAYFRSDGGTVRNNRCRGNGGYGLFIGSRAKPRLEDNQCEGNSKGNTYREPGRLGRTLGILVAFVSLVVTLTLGFWCFHVFEVWSTCGVWAGLWLFLLAVWWTFLWAMGGTELVGEIIERRKSGEPVARIVRREEWVLLQMLFVVWVVGIGYGILFKYIVRHIRGS
jgi:parallel beta-helix repeat protein